MIGSRIKYLDVAKGVLILLLLIHHLNDSACLHVAWSEYYIYAYKWQSLYTAFFMQAFFFISGYCSNFQKPFYQLVITAARQLLLPILIFVVINSFIDFFFFKDFSYLSRLLSLQFWLSGASFWFLFALFFSKIVVWIYNRYCNIFFSLLLSIVCIYIGVCFNNTYGHNIFCVFHALVSILFVYLGYLVKVNNLLDVVCNKHLVWMYILLLLCIKFCGFDIPSVTAGIWITIRQIPVFIILALTGTASLIWLCKLIDKNYFLEFFGRNSLIVYGTHYPYLGVMSYLILSFYYPRNLLEGVLFITVVLILTIFACYLIIKVLNSKYLRYTIGKW